MSQSVTVVLFLTNCVKYSLLKESDGAQNGTQHGAQNGTQHGAKHGTQHGKHGKQHEAQHGTQHGAALLAML